MDLKELLLELNDNDYKKFNDKIINTKKKTIGVRTPILKKIAKDISVNNIIVSYDESIYECFLVKGFVISYNKDINYVIKNLHELMLKNDNWAVCDMVTANCKIYNKNKEIVLNYVIDNIVSNNNWIQRYCFIILLDYFIEKTYLNDIFNFISQNNNDYYYVMMAKAWLISICYIKFPIETLEFLKEKAIDKITYNKAIDKIRDSKRVNEKDKKTLLKMKIR